MNSHKTWVQIQITEKKIKVNYLKKGRKLFVERKIGLRKTYLEGERVSIVPNALMEIAQQI